MYAAIIRRDHNLTRALQAARAAELQAYYDAFGEAARLDAERPRAIIEPYRSPVGRGGDPDAEPDTDAPSDPDGEPESDPAEAPAGDPAADPDAEPTPVDPPVETPLAAASGAHPRATVHPLAAHPQLRKDYQQSRNHRR